MSNLENFPPSPDIPKVEGIKDPFAFQKFCIRIGAIPTTYTEALTLEEQLLYFIDYLRNIVIPAVNNNADTVNALIDEFEKLYNYTHDYFDNLDVQQEVNNKLEQMVTSGELQEIITAYLQVNGILGFNTVADMKNADNLINGSFTKTYGNQTYNDGKGKFYKVREIKNTDVVDEINIIALKNPELIAELIKDLDFENLVNTVNDNKIELESKLKKCYNFNSPRYHINLITGNDNNDGLTAETAWKSIDKLFELLNNGETDIRCYLDSAGTYELNKNVISHSVIHITATVANCIIEFNNQNENNTQLDSTFYHCHLNFNGLDKNNPLIIQNKYEGYAIYGDGCSIEFKYVKFQNCTDFSVSGNILHANYLTVPRIYISGANADINNLSLNNYNATGSLIIVRYASNVNLRGNTVFADKTGYTFNVLTIERSVLTLQANIKNPKQITSGYGISSIYGIIHTTDTYLNQWTQLSSNDTPLNYSQTLLAKGNIVLPQGFKP